MVTRFRGAQLCAATLMKCFFALALSLMLLSSCADTYAQEARKLIKKVDPVYPELARRMNLTGVVKVEVSIGADGSVTDVRPLGGNPVFVTAVEDAVKQWKYASGAAETKKLEFKF